MRADRLVATLLLMQSRGRVTAAELAEEREVSVATARRDLEALSAAGIPVYPQPGRGGGWSLLGGARTDLSGLTAAEARALFLLVGPAAGVAGEGRAAQAGARAAGYLPRRRRGRRQRGRHRPGALGWARHAALRAGGGPAVRRGAAPKGAHAVRQTSPGSRTPCADRSAGAAAARRSTIRRSPGDSGWPVDAIHRGSRPRAAARTSGWRARRHLGRPVHRVV